MPHFNGRHVNFLRFSAGLAVAMLLSLTAWAVPENLYNPQLEENESKFYAIETIPVPTNVVLEAGGMSFAADGSLTITLREGSTTTDHQ